jgi:hypothetical protein
MESTVYTSFWPAFYCSKLMGAMPLKRVGCQLQWSWAASVYILVYAAPCTVFTFATPYLLLRQSNTTLSVSRVLQISGALLVGLTGLISLVISLRKIGALPSLLEEFRCVDGRYLRTPPETNRNVLLYSICHCLIILCTCGTVLVVICSKHIVMSAVIDSFLSLSKLYLVVAESQFVCLCYALSQRYEHINNHIRKLRNSELSYRNGLRDVSTSKAENESEIYGTLKKLRKGHRCLRETGKNLNQIYNGQLFLSVFSRFILAVYAFYYGITYGDSRKCASTGMFVWRFRNFLRFYIIEIQVKR